MKKLILIALVLVSCTKSKNSSPKVSAVNGCVSCRTYYYVVEYQTNIKDTIYAPIDSTMCHVSDNVLNGYIQLFTYSGPPQSNVATNPNNTEVITTTCINK